MTDKIDQIHSKLDSDLEANPIEVITAEPSSIICRDFDLIGPEDLERFLVTVSTALDPYPSRVIKLLGRKTSGWV